MPPQETFVLHSIPAGNLMLEFRKLLSRRESKTIFFKKTIDKPIFFVYIN